METTTRVTGEAQEQGKHVAATLGSKGQELTDLARTEVSAVRDEISRQSGKIVQDLAEQVRVQLEAQAGQAVAAFRKVVDQGDALVRGNPDQAGPVADIAGQVVGQLRAMSETVESRGLDGTVEEIRRFARRRPTTFLLGATALGFGLGRLARSSVSAQSAGPEDHVVSQLPSGSAYYGSGQGLDEEPLGVGEFAEAGMSGSVYSTDPVMPVMPPMVMGVDDPASEDGL